MFQVEVTGSTARAASAQLFSSLRCAFTLAINLDPAVSWNLLQMIKKTFLQLAVFQMLWPIQELLGGWRLKSGSILGRYSRVSFMVHDVNLREYKTLLQSLHFIGWTSFRKRIVLSRLWRCLGLRPLCRNSSSLHKRPEPLRTESLCRWYFTCHHERVHLLHHQR